MFMEGISMFQRVSVDGMCVPFAMMLSFYDEKLIATGNSFDVSLVCYRKYFCGWYIL